ncbi:MAG: response regulator, partial [Verrucomicrobia bacterium]|nr:response regulator [Verrucomicrobiota bacterium]
PAKTKSDESGDISAPHEEIPGGNETILIVEDERPVQKLIKAILNRYGYTVFEARNGIEALKIWNKRADQIDLVITDMVMPEGVSGTELVRKFKQTRPDIKAIYSSGYSTDLLENTDELIENVNFLRKPYHPVTLAKAVRRQLDVGKFQNK